MEYIFIIWNFYNNFHPELILVIWRINNNANVEAQGEPILKSVSLIELTILLDCQVKLWDFHRIIDKAIVTVVTFSFVKTVS